MMVNGNSYYYASNGRGDILALTDANGTKVASYRYDPWGRELKPDESETGSGQEGITKGDSEIGELNPYRYAGYRYDSKLRLYFLKTRYYDSQLGRFLSRDTYKGDDVEKVAIAQNKYVYANNNPVNMTDPNGQKATGSKNPKSGTKPKAKSPSKPKPKSKPSSKHDTKKSNSQKKQSTQKQKPSEKKKIPGNKPTNKKNTSNNKNTNSKKPSPTKKLDANKKAHEDMI